MVVIIPFLLQRPKISLSQQIVIVLCVLQLTTVPQHVQLQELNHRLPHRNLQSDPTEEMILSHASLFQTLPTLWFHHLALDLQPLFLPIADVLAASVGIHPRHAIRSHSYYTRKITKNAGCHHIRSFVLVILFYSFVSRIRVIASHLTLRFRSIESSEILFRPPSLLAFLPARASVRSN